MGPGGSARPMVVAIAGGALQGVEATYLARKAGFETLLLDRRSDAPATGICRRFEALDLADHGALSEALSGALGSVDMVLPATENTRTLQSLADWCGQNRMPLAFDPVAYAVSSSKTASDVLFRKLGIPAPTPWPECAFPVLAKPDGGSGSAGVEVFPNIQALEERFGALPPPGWVLQEYLSGPSYSIEVMGRPEAYTTLQVTDLEMDRAHDCKRVSAPSSLPPHLCREMEEMAVSLAEAVALSGIMDVEVVLHEGRLKVLEIDARLPSQTPAAVYHSTGINMVERLATLFTVEGEVGADSVPTLPVKGSILEHIRVGQGHLAVGGERMMAGAGPLHPEEDFFGADEALTNHAPGRDDWVATLMVTGSDLQDAWDHRNRVIDEVRNRFGVHTYSDERPPERPPQMR
jgi:pyrrolysine biosynthesis protein PylC